MNEFHDWLWQEYNDKNITLEELKKASVCRRDALDLWDNYCFCSASDATEMVMTEIACVIWKIEKNI